MRLNLLLAAILPVLFGLLEVSCTGGGNPYSPGTNGSGGGIPPRTDPSEAKLPVPLTGPSIGSNTASDYDLRKTAPVYVRMSHGALRVATYAFMVRPYTSQSVPYLIIPVENISSDSVTGFTKLMGVSVFADGVEVLRKDNLYARGKVGVSTASGLYTQTCVWPGMTAYCLRVLSNGHFNANFQIEIDSVVSSPAEFRDPYTQVYASDYSVFDDALQIWAKNYGSNSASIDSSWLYILLDYRSDPVLWGFTNVWDSGILYPGFSTYRKEFIDFDGDADRVFVPVDYDPVHSGLSRKRVPVVDYWEEAQVGEFQNSDAARLHSLESREAERERLHQDALPGR